MCAVTAFELNDKLFGLRLSGRFYFARGQCGEKRRDHRPVGAAIIGDPKNSSLICDIDDIGIVRVNGHLRAGEPIATNVALYCGQGRRRESQPAIVAAKNSTAIYASLASP